jgi:hypothetical protein
MACGTPAGAYRTWNRSDMLPGTEIMIDRQAEEVWNYLCSLGKEEPLHEP